jgi:hypothetical protein
MSYVGAILYSRPPHGGYFRLIGKFYVSRNSSGCTDFMSKEIILEKVMVAQLVRKFTALSGSLLYS